MRSRLEVSADQPAAETFTLPCVHETLYVCISVCEGTLRYGNLSDKNTFSRGTGFICYFGFNVKGGYHNYLRVYS